MNQSWHVRFEVFTAVMFQVEVFWVVTPCSVAVGYRHFIDPCYLHLQGELETVMAYLKYIYLD
jgi:hypothetical protein